MLINLLQAVSLIYTNRKKWDVKALKAHLALALLVQVVQVMKARKRRNKNRKGNLSSRPKNLSR